MELSQKGKINRSFLGKTSKTLMTFAVLLILTLSLSSFVSNIFEDNVSAQEYAQRDEYIIVPGDTEEESLDLESEICINTIFE